MRLLEIGACALAIVSVDAFENTSPFLFFSSSEYGFPRHQCLYI